MKLYNKKPLYISENGIFRRTKKSLYSLTKEGRVAALGAGALTLVLLLVILASYL